VTPWLLRVERRLTWRLEADETGTGRQVGEAREATLDVRRGRRWARAVLPADEALEARVAAALPALAAVASPGAPGRWRLRPGAAVDWPDRVDAGGWAKALRRARAAVVSLAVEIERVETSLTDARGARRETVRHGTRLHVVAAGDEGCQAFALSLPTPAPRVPPLDALLRFAAAPRRPLAGGGPVRLAAPALAQLLDRGVAGPASAALLPGRPGERVDDLGRPRRAGGRFVTFRERAAHLPAGTLPPGEGPCVRRLDAIVAGGGPIRLAGVAEAGVVRIAVDPEDLRAALASPARRGVSLEGVPVGGVDYFLPEVDLGAMSWTAW
jgi:hypothetical protein